MPEGRVNTLMAGAATGARRSDFTAAGYAGDGMGGDLYIERVQAGSAQDLLRDNNRPGYAGEELDGDGLPFSFLMEEERREKRSEREKKKKNQPLTFGQWLRRAAARERGAAIACCVLAVLIAILGSFLIQSLIDGKRTQDQIALYDSGAKEYDALITTANGKISIAQLPERICNAAVNELGMERRERVATETIYIQTSNLAIAPQMAAAPAQEELSWLDWLLSVADMLDFAS